MSVTGFQAAVPLVMRPRTRACWAATAAATLSLGAVSVLMLIQSAGRANAAMPVVGLMAWGYLWLGLAALDVARCRRARLEVGPDGLAILHDGLLLAPIVIERRAVEAVLLDARPAEDRRAAASVRRGGIAPPSFLDPSLPVVSAAGSSHSSDGTAVTPNVVVLLRAPLRAPKVPLAVRALLRLAQGKTGRYRGPRTGREMRGIRLVVADAKTVAVALAPWNVLATLTRDERYLAPVAEADHAKARRRRLILAAGVGSVAVFFVALQIIARR